MKSQPLIEKDGVELYCVADESGFCIGVNDCCCEIDNLTSDDMFEVVVGIIYAVWKSNPNKANDIMSKLNNAWDEISKSEHDNKHKSS